MAENPFATKDDQVIANEINEIAKETNEEVKVNALTEIKQNEDNSISKKEPLNDEDEREVIIPEQQETKKGKQKLKRKLNDLDSPIEEAENDSDFTIKDGSNTELEEDDDDTEMENDFSDETEADDTDLSDWARNTRKRSTRNGGHRSSKRNKKKSRRYDSDDYSDDYGYKPRRTSKRITYREISTSEDEDFDDDYSDNSEKYKKNKKASKKKKKAESDTDEFLSDQDSDERAVIKKKKKKIKVKDDSSNEDEQISSPEESKRKSKRAKKKKVYDDFTDIDESEEEDEQLAEEDVLPLVDTNEKESTINEKESTTAEQQTSIEPESISTFDQLPPIEITQVQLPPLNAAADESNSTSTVVKEKPPVVKKTPKIKITKPNPKLAKYQNLNKINAEFTSSIEQPLDPQFNLSKISNDANPGEQHQPLELDTSIENTTNSASAKKKRGRQPKNTPKEIKDPNAPPAKRGRKPKTSSENLVNLNSNLEPATIPNSALSQLTQFASSTDLTKLDPANSNKFLTDVSSQVPTVDSVKQLLNNAELAKKGLSLNNSLLVQQEIIARHAALINNSTDKSKFIYLKILKFFLLHKPSTNRTFLFFSISIG